MHTKKALLALIIACPLLLASCNNEQDKLNSSYSTETKSEVKKISFADYEFVYFDDGSGVLYSEETDKKLLEVLDYSFRYSNLNLINEEDSLINIVELIGFPRFLGVSSSLSLDFGNYDSDIYRVFFSNDMLYSNLEILDYDDPDTWIDPNRKEFPSLSDLVNIKIGMSLDEVISIIGKPQGSTGYGSIMFTFAIDDGSTLLTRWNPGEYDAKNGPYYLASFEIIN